MCKESLRKQTEAPGPHHTLSLLVAVPFLL